MICLYEPFNHNIRKTTIKDLATLIGISKFTLYQHLNKPSYYKKLGCFLLKEKPRITTKRKLNELLNPKDEVWKFNKKYQLYVSNLGRFKNKNNKYKVAHDENGPLMIIHNKKSYKAADIVYQTFIGELKEGHHAYPKNSLSKDINAENLYATTFSDYCSTKRPLCNAKPVLLVDTNNQIVEEFTSTVEAQNALYINRTAIANRCNKRHVENGLTFMWAKDYEVIA